MLIVNKKTDGTPLFVERDASTPGYNWPMVEVKNPDGTVKSEINLPTRVTDKGVKMVQVGITYYDLEDSDVSIGDDVLATYAKLGIDAKDFVNACSAGLRLLVGNKTLQPYAVKQGVKLAHDELNKLVAAQRPELVTEYLAISEDKRNLWLVQNKHRWV